MDLSRVHDMLISEQEYNSLSQKYNKSDRSGRNTTPVKETYAQICEKNKLDPTTGSKITISEEQLEAFLKANSGVFIKDSVLHVVEPNINKLEESVVLPHPSTFFDN